MSESLITRERVFFTASALAAAGLGAVACRLIQRHREQEDDITLEGADPELAAQFAARTTPASDQPIDSDVAYVGLEDDTDRALGVTEVHAIGASRYFSRLRKLVINGPVHLWDRED